jgi:archaellum biogenesis protein FlaJ (TadC family)
MLTKKTLSIIWCVFILVIVWIAVLPSDSLVHHLAVQYDSNRWLRFLAYASIVAIPVSSWRTRTGIAISFIPAFIGMALEMWQAHVHGLVGRPENITPDLFGFAAGVLFGLNIRVMRKSAKSSHNANSGPSEPSPK